MKYPTTLVHALQQKLLSNSAAHGRSVSRPFIFVKTDKSENSQIILLDIFPFHVIIGKSEEGVGKDFLFAFPTRRN
ncbi:hypothetical protein JQM63_02450 [Oscillibacter valericigenes]|nr:hypothetical protein [Oscillibacter valericigenes]